MSIARRLSLLISALAACCAVLAPAAQASWSVAAGTVSTTTSQANGVACTSASSCLVVGSQAGGPTALASKWNGSTFAKLTPASTTSELYGVGCTSATLCFAVGTNYAGGGATPHAESWNGTTWANSIVPTPAGATLTELASVACPGTTSCFAAGYYTTATTTDVPLVDRWVGTHWTAQSLSLPAGTTTAQLSDVACSSTSTCTAVGYYDTASPPRRTLAFRWNGTAWSTQVAANPAGATQSQLQGVACPGATTCVAVGSYIDALGVQHSQAQTWNGTTWTVKSVPDPAAGTDPALSDVSCVSTSCTAVGGYSAASSIEPTAAGWNGTTWSLATVPKGTGVSDASLTGVSCPTTCVATAASIFDGSSGITGLRATVALGP
jgi:hypothetical protein